MIIKKIFNFCCPHVCVFCGEPTGHNLDLCKACEQELPLLGNYCQYCAKPLKKGLKICGPCLIKKPVFDQIFTFGIYQTMFKHLIKGLKFGGQLVNFGRFQKNHFPILYRSIVLAFTFYRKYFGK